MRMFSLVLVTAASLTCLVAKAQNLVADGNFSDSANSGWTNVGSGNTTEIPGWTVDSAGSPSAVDGGGGIQIQNNEFTNSTYGWPNSISGYPPGGTGAQLVQLSEQDDGTAPGGIYQDIPTVAGDTYTLTLDYVARSEKSGTAAATAEITFGTGTEALETTPGSYETATLTIVAGPGSSTLLDITQTDIADVSGNSMGIADLSVVQVVSVPEPTAALPLLVSSVGLAFFFFRRRSLAV